MNEVNSVSLKCNYCGSEFFRKPYKIKKGKIPFCSHACQIKYSNAMRSIDARLEIRCTTCKKIFSIKKRNLDRRSRKYGTFCSKQCYYDFVTGKDFSTYITLQCSVCGKEFERKSSIEKANRKKFNNICCSRRCSSQLQHSSDDDLKRRLFYQLARVIRSGKINVGDDVTEDYLLDVWNSQKGKCPYTGESLVLKAHRSRGTKIPNQASIDRIDSTFGYIRGNIEFVSLIANYAKNTWTKAELIEFCKKVATNA